MMMDIGKPDNMSKLIRYDLEVVQRAQLKKIVDIIKEKATFYNESGKTLFVGIAGLPGAGKSNFTKNIQILLHQVHHLNSVIVSQNGYHFSK